MEDTLEMRKKDKRFSMAASLGMSRSNLRPTRRYSVHSTNISPLLQSPIRTNSSLLKLSQILCTLILQLASSNPILMNHFLKLTTNSVFLSCNFIHPFSLIEKNTTLTRKLSQEAEVHGTMRQISGARLSPSTSNSTSLIKVKLRYQMHL